MLSEKKRLVNYRTDDESISRSTHNDCSASIVAFEEKKGIAIPWNRAHSDFTVIEHLEYLLTVLVDAIDKILNLRAIGGFL